jgi:hypothetical protein
VVVSVRAPFVDDGAEADLVVEAGGGDDAAGFLLLITLENTVFSFIATDMLPESLTFFWVKALKEKVVH